MQPSTSSNQPIQNQPQHVHYTSSVSSSTGHGFVSFPETDPVRVYVLDATCHEQRTRRNRRAGQNVRDARAEINRERMKYDPVHVGQLGAGASRPEVRFPVLEGDVDTLRQGLRRRPLPPGLHERPLQPGLQPEDEGTSFFTYGDSEQSEIPVDTKVGDYFQEEKPSQCEGSEQSEESSEKNCVFSFHTNPVVHVRKDLHFTWKILHRQLYVFWTLVAQEPWDLGRQSLHFADMWTHIPTVDFGMRFTLQAEDFFSQTLNNRNVLRRLSSSCTIMDGIPIHRVRHCRRR